MNRQTSERCCECDENTGRAGRADDSLYIDDTGPYCEECFDRARRAQLGTLAADNERLERWVNDLQSDRYINCAYCGHRYGPEDEILNMQQALHEHIATCSKHPLSAANREIARLRATMETLRPIVEEIHGHRELADCWFYFGDDNADCGNWPACNPHCPLAQLRELVGIVPQEDGRIDKQPKRE